MVWISVLIVPATVRLDGSTSSGHEITALKTVEVVSALKDI